MRIFSFWIEWIVAVIVVIVLFFLLAAAHHHLRPSEGPSDTYAALSAIFTLLAFAGVILALRTQRRDIDSQNARDDFFQLLEAWQDVVDNTSYDLKTGRQAFRQMSDDLSKYMAANLPDGTSLTAQKIQEMYEIFYTPAVSEPLNHYFRLVYNIVRYVDEEPALRKPDKERLLRLVRALISEPEFNLIFWSGLSQYGRRKFHPLIDKYDLLQNFLLNGIKDEAMRLYPLTYKRRQR